VSLDACVECSYTISWLDLPLVAVIQSSIQLCVYAGCERGKLGACEVECRGQKNYTYTAE
jgi:hypothetical protein